MILRIIEITLLLTGASFMLVAAIGIVRMDDLFTRLQVAGKASTLGAMCILLAVAFHFGDMAVTIRALVIIGFIVLTVPVGAHMLARAGFITNVPLSPSTVVNELEGHYDPVTDTLAGLEPIRWEITVGDASDTVGKQVAELNLPAGVLIIMIQRRDEVVVPRGQTRIEADDRLTVMAEPRQMNDVRALFQSPTAT